MIAAARPSAASRYMNSLTPAGVYQFITFLFLFDPRHNRNRGYTTSLIYHQSSEGALHPLFRPESTAPKFPKHLGLDQLRSEPNRWYARNFVLLTTSWLSLTSLARQLLPSWYEYGVILSPLSWIAIYLSRLPRVGHSSNRTLTRFLRTCGFEVL
jgi:hypothetical protein